MTFAVGSLGQDDFFSTGSMAMLKAVGSTSAAYIRLIAGSPAVSLVAVSDRPDPPAMCL